jgi:hypothetical protein
MAPKVYSDWLPLIDRFEKGDDHALEEMKTGQIEWTNVVAQRWSAHIANAVSSRLQLTSRQLQLGFSRCGGNLFAVAQTMLGARRSLSTLVELTGIPCMNEDLRAHLLSEITRFVDESQRSLEKSAMQHGRQGEPVLRVLRENRLRLVLSTDTKDNGQPTSSSNPGVESSRRRNFIQEPNG